MHKIAYTATSKAFRKIISQIQKRTFAYCGNRDFQISTFIIFKTELLFHKIHIIKNLTHQIAFL